MKKRKKKTEGRNDWKQRVRQEEKILKVKEEKTKSSLT